MDGPTIGGNSGGGGAATGGGSCATPLLIVSRQVLSNALAVLAMSEASVFSSAASSEPASALTLGKPKVSPLPFSLCAMLLAASATSGVKLSISQNVISLASSVAASSSLAI